MLDLDETLVHSQLGQTAAADFQFDLQVPEAGRQTVFVKVGYLAHKNRIWRVDGCS